MNQVIELIVAPDGTTQLETKGFTGPSCQEASRFLEQALGTKASQTLTAGFYLEQPAKHVAQAGGRL